MTMLYDVPAPAKLNLFLHVTGRRTDGYHTLQTVFRFVDLCDVLDFDLRSDGRITCSNTQQDLAHEDDLIVRAARALQSVSGTSLGAQIHCRKRIPAGAGLGGGSSDAATTLMALNRLWNTGLSRAQLTSVALRLGADVPVFIFGQSAFAQGIGEDLQAVKLPSRAYVIVQPKDTVSTAAIFSAPDLTRGTPCLKMSDFLNWQRRTCTQGDARRQSQLQRSLPLFGRNDLQDIASARYPGVAQVGAYLAQLGFAARMTGSGACWFVEFATLEQARVCQQEIAAKIAVSDAHAVQSSWVCQGLPEHPLRQWVCMGL